MINWEIGNEKIVSLTPEREREREREREKFNLAATRQCIHKQFNDLNDQTI